ncbi:MAG: hypothetical protein JW936_06330 [Sedimentisphaerales bacterium]|nr:hypothetical protein [Sedimentisphaerales bacterium]
MPPSKSIIKLEHLKPEIKSAVQTLAQKLIGDLDDNLLSLTVVGSALTDDFHLKYSDINTVLVTKHRSHELLHIIADYGAAMGKLKLRAPLLMTAEYIQSSLDVFAVELLDFQLNHITVIGDDPFSNLTFEKRHVRLQCERQFKSALIQLRQGYIRSLAKPKYVAEILTACIGELLPMLRAMLWIQDIDRPATAQATLNAAAEAFNFESGPIAKIVQAKKEHNTIELDQVEVLFEKLYQTIDNLSRFVDQTEDSK